MGSSRSTGSPGGKERLKWTQELHVRFEEAINLLGGADRATPRSILRTMQVPGLTIYHVKSHLQKYRIQKLIPESGPGEGKYVRRNLSEMLRIFSATSAAQFNEALRLQKEVHNGMSDQTEVQRSLKLKIEAQERFLERMTDHDGERNHGTSIHKPKKPFSGAIMSMPALAESEESESTGKESDSDAESSLKRFRQLEEESCNLTTLRVPAPAPAPAYDDYELAAAAAASQYLLGPYDDETSSSIFHKQQQQLMGMGMMSRGISPTSSLSYPAHHDVNSSSAWNVPISGPSPFLP